MSHGESMEEDDMVMRVGNSMSTERERDEPMRREGLQAQGSYKEVPRPSRGLALATAKRSLTLPPPFVRAGPQPVYPID